MKRIAFFVVLLVLLIAGGGLTANLAANNLNGTTIIPAVLKQTDHPDASVFVSTPQKSEQLFLFVGFILFNLVGMAVTIMVVMWLLHRQVKQARASDGTGTVSLAAASDTAVEQT